MTKKKEEKKKCTFVLHDNSKKKGIVEQENKITVWVSGLRDKEGKPNWVKLHKVRNKVVIK